MDMKKEIINVGGIKITVESMEYDSGSSYIDFYVATPYCEDNVEGDYIVLGGFGLQDNIDALGDAIEKLKAIRQKMIDSQT